MKLFPNCSEIVWRLNIPKKSTREDILRALEGREKETIETDTATFPNCCVEDMLNLLENYNGDIEEVVLDYVDNLGGGGNWNYVEECFETAKKCFKGEITREEAINEENVLWND